MVNGSIVSSGGQKTAHEGWDALFRANRESRASKMGNCGSILQKNAAAIALRAMAAAYQLT